MTCRPAGRQAPPSPGWPAIALLLPLLLVGCVGRSSGSETSNGETVELSDSESGRTVDLAPGDLVAVRLPSNPGTGFEWELETTTDGVMTEVERAYVAGADDEGSPGQDVIRLKASGAGETTVTLSYRRPWETDIKPEQVVVFDFVVAD